MGGAGRAPLAVRHYRISHAIAGGRRRVMPRNCSRHRTSSIACWGWVCRGGVVLIGGDPGIGKSYASIAIAGGALTRSATDAQVPYVSRGVGCAAVAAREAVSVDAARVRLLSEISLERIVATVGTEKPSVPGDGFDLDAVLSSCSRRLARWRRGRMCRTADAFGETIGADADHDRPRDHDTAGRAARPRAYGRHRVLQLASRTVIPPIQAFKN